MANQTIYPYGTNGELPSNIGLVNDLVTGGADKALTAEQGVVIKGLIDQSDAENYVEVDMFIKLYAVSTGNYINYTNNVWATSGNTRSFFVPIEPGVRYKVTAGGQAARVAILSSNTDTVDTTPVYATGETQIRVVDANTYLEFTAPSDAHYLSINKTLSRTDITPANLSYFKKSDICLKEYVDKEVGELRGAFEEEVVYDELNVVTNSAANITITKDGNGAIIVENIATAPSKYALIELPNTLKVGVEYRLSFDYDANFTRNSTWWLGFVDSSYALTSGGVDLYPLLGQSVTYDFTYKIGDEYLRLASNSQYSAYVRITGFSISENKRTVAELSDEIKEMKDSLSDVNMNNMLTQAKYVTSSPTTQPLALLHFTDIHGDTKAAADILNFFEKNSSNIDDMINTGDSVYYYWNSPDRGYEWYQGVGIADALFVLGNHDGAADDNSAGWKEGSADWDFKGKEWDFDTYFANYITSRGVTPPAGYDDSSSPYYKACYWHKDYANAKIRLIGIDCMHFNDGVRYTSNDQETWLAAKLQETLTSGNAAYGYSVIFMCHYAIDDFSGNNETWDDTTHKFIYNSNLTGGRVIDSHTSDCVAFHRDIDTSYTAVDRFSMRNRIGEVGSPSYTKGDDNPIADVIQSWMNNGGKYVAWFSGHTHTEYMYYPAKYPNMLCVGNSQAGNTRGNSEADRSDSSLMHTSANLYVIDTQNKLFKIIRVGNTLDKKLISRTCLCYDYQNKKVISCM